MERLERKHYLKHYQGGFAMVLSEGQTATGQIEKVDMEDGSTLIQSGDRSQWVDGDMVTPSLKKWKDLSDQDLITIFSNAKFGGRRIDLNGMKLMNSNMGSFKGFMSDSGDLFLREDWSMHYLEPDSRIILCSNTGTIIFLLCELGYDVTEAFNK